MSDRAGPAGDAGTDDSGEGEPPAWRDDADGEAITTAHGAGTRRTRELLEEAVVDRFAPDGSGREDGGGSAGDGGGRPSPAAHPDGVGLAAMDDGAVLPGVEGSVVVTTDSHVVDPPVFPGGDLGELAVAGTVNDLAVMGATDPMALTCSLVVEAGTSRAHLDRVLSSMAETCERAGCRVRTGDTKVMGAGEVDGVVVNTTGVGTVPQGPLPDAGLSPGDELVVTGTVGDHGIALLAAREGFDLGDGLASDVAPVNDLVARAREAGDLTAAADPTRGGLATALNRLARASDAGVVVEESAIPVAGPVASAGELLGIDPLTVACEGVAVLGVAGGEAEAVVRALREHPLGRDAARVGRVVDDHAGRVVLDTGIGRRYLTEPESERLPRIC